MIPILEHDRAILFHGDAREIAAHLPPESIDALVCDPPAGIGFMGKEWDHHKGGRDEWIAWLAEIMRGALSTLKPGAHALVWALPRTSHWTATALEDAGFEIRDVVMHLFGTGFPKSFDVGEGRGTALKPAAEHWILCRKPLIGTVAANVLEHGTGALNIDGCRVGHGEGGSRSGEVSKDRRYTSEGGTNFSALPGPRGGDARGRWPANVVLDEEAGAALDEQTGILTSGKVTKSYSPDVSTSVALGAKRRTLDPSKVFSDSGGASRFFYCAKVARSERGDSTHPTMKPIALMRWLVRLVTPPGGIVLDPFLGSGTTGVAALAEGFSFVGVEKDPEYIPITTARIEHALKGAP